MSNERCCQKCGSADKMVRENAFTKGVMLCKPCYKKIQTFVANRIEEFDTQIAMEDIREYHAYRNELIRALKAQGVLRG